MIARRAQPASAGLTACIGNIDWMKSAIHINGGQCGVTSEANQRRSGDDSLNGGVLRADPIPDWNSVHSGVTEKAAVAPRAGGQI